MRFNTKPSVLMIMTLLLISTSNIALAKDKSGKERDLVKRLQRNLEQQQVQRQQIEQEKNTLIEKNNQQDAALKDSVAEKRKLEGQVQSTFKQKQDLQVELKALKAELESANQKLNLVEHDRNSFAQQAQSLITELGIEKKEARELKAQNTALKTNFETVYTAEQNAKKMQETCEVKNKQLYLYSKTLVTNYKNASFWHALKENEPFLGFGGVATQNLLQEYKDKIDQEKIITN